MIEFNIDNIDFRMQQIKYDYLKLNKTSGLQRNMKMLH